MKSIDLCHDRIIAARKPLLAYEENNDFESWREQVRQKLTELLGDLPQSRCDLNVRVEWEKNTIPFTKSG